MGQASINNSWSFLALTVVFLLTQVAYVGAAPSRRGDLNFPETIFDLPSPQYLSESIFLEQHDEPSRCNNFTIGEASSCPNPLLTTLYGKPYSNFDPPFSNKKMWFARRLNKGIYVAGQLSRRQIRYAADSGFKSIATIFDHEGTGENNVTFELTTDEEEALVKQAGMKFFRILKPTDDWTKIIAIERMRDVYPKVELPALFHCERGVAVTLHILLYYAQGYQRSSRAVPKIDNERFYELTNRHGLDFVDLFAPFTEALVEEVFGEPMPPSATKPSVSAPMWFDYWQTHPVRGNWFMAGQITSSDIPVIKSTGVLTILNIRQGLLNNGDLSQENAELINIKSSATFDSSGNPIRQRKETLETLVIDKTRPTQYVSQDSLVNYEKVNIDEFGDHIGYNERREQDAVREAGLDYTHLPLQVFPARLKPPGLNEPTKAWWAKEITPLLHVAGRLSERQIKYAAEAGFRSVLSLFPYPDDCPGNCGGEYLPVTTEEKNMVERTGMQFVPLLNPLDEWSSVEAVEKFTSVIELMDKPALLHCDRGYTIVFVVLLYLANQTRYDPNFEPRIYSQEFYDISASMGLDFLSRIPVEVVSEVTGEPEIDLKRLTVPRPIYDPEDWLDFWFAHPVYYSWFLAGQIYDSHLEPLNEFGYKSVLNVRSGALYRGNPNQEEVNLLNVKSKTGTYGDKQTLPRQSEERLEATRIKPDAPHSYVSASSTVNYEERNDHEFGDDVGYNETLERNATEKSGLEYYHIPLHENLDGFDTYIRENLNQLLEVGKKGPVLIHCDSGKRSALVSVFVAAVQYDLSLDWALQRLKEIGYGISAQSHPQIYRVYQEHLAYNQRVESQLSLFSKIRVQITKFYSIMYGLV